MPSTVIRNSSYDPERRILRIVYISGNIYDYLDVPAAVYEAMNAAGSKGGFLNRHIKGRYDFERVK